MASLTAPQSFDFRKALTTNRLLGLWRMLTGFRPAYLVAVASLAVAATAKTTTFLLLRYFVDDVLDKKEYLFPNNLSLTLAVIGLGFLGLAAVVLGVWPSLMNWLAEPAAHSLLAVLAGQ